MTDSKPGCAGACRLGPVVIAGPDAAAVLAAELRRWTPEEVVELQLLPYSTERSLREKCYRREVFHHLDGGRITFTADDIREENERHKVEPLDV